MMMFKYNPLKRKMCVYRVYKSRDFDELTLSLPVREFVESHEIDLA